jgi:Skp family chaperone for outer membrane proteins
MKRTVISAAVAALCWGTWPAHGLEIPLTGGEGGRGMKIGYVDMDRIFEVFPQTVAAKEDYTKQLEKKRQLLADKEAELADIKTRISVLEATLKDGGLAPAATPTPDPDALPNPDAPAKDPNAPPAAPAGDPNAQGAAPAPGNLESMRQDLVTKQAEYDDARKQAADDLSAFEGRQSQIILGKIYTALRDLAQEEQVELVVDKASILFGSAEVDLTEKLQQRVRGF